MNPMTAPDGQIDQIIGSAYQVIKYVAENMETLITLAESLDPLVDSMQTAFEALRRTYAETGYTLLKATFKTGAAVSTAYDALIDDTTGIAYSWGGALPKFVPQNSTVANSGGISSTTWVARDLASLRQDLASPSGVSLVGGAISAYQLENKLAPVYSQVRENQRRIYAEAGFNVVGVFQTGFVITNTNDVGIDERNGLGYRWSGVIPVGGKIVPPGSTPDSTGGISPNGDWIDLADVSLRSEFSEPTGTSLIGTQSGTTLADYMLKGNGIDPAMIVGPLSDAGRMQAAIDLWVTDKTRSILLHRAYDVTGFTLRVANVETESPERSLVIIGGELIKLDAGNIFDKPLTGQTLATSEVRFIGTKFRGPNVAGTYIINGHNDLNGTYDSAHMIRVSFVGCFGTGIQVAYAKPTGYLQSITMDANCVWRKWAGYLFDCGWMYDVQCFNPRMEAGDAVWVTREVNADPACSGCHFSGGDVEGLNGASGPAFDVGVCIGTTISPAYMEANAGGDINCSKGVGFHKGLTIMGVKMEPKATQAADPNYYSIRLGKGAVGAFNLGGNFSTSNMYDCTAGNQAVVIDHSSFVAAGKKLFGPNVHRRFEPTGIGFHGQLTGGFGVGALYEYGLFYVDIPNSDEKRYFGFSDQVPTATTHPSVKFARGSYMWNTNAVIKDRQYGSGVTRPALIKGWQCTTGGVAGIAVWVEDSTLLPY